MKKRSFGLFLLVSLMALGLWVGSAIEGMATPAYYSWCYADYDEGPTHAYYYDEGPTHAYVGNPLAYAEARADIWELGAWAYVRVDEITPFVGTLHADSYFFQEFRVTQAGVATINFSYDGSLSAQNNGPGTMGGEYSIDFYFWALDDYGHFYGEIGNLSQPDGPDPDPGAYKPYGDIFSFNYDFTDDQIGDTFGVDLYLAFELSGDIDYVGAGNAEFMSDFYNTAKIESFSGAINPVPIPGAVWLLGSGLLGFIGIGFRRKQKN